ncbi:MAG: hypothetical protein AUJ72_01960 [Candidatus Omnitrophica bacterium CG1_02_46_14]|nr:MAG: hypothetical protein AUJ72_01960 [Candidatus Omnitrophica bacterium CG1_02_46_14]
MNYLDAVEFIDSFTNYEKSFSSQYPENFKLDRMRRLAKELGNPQNAYECVIIAGSKGKGSTAAILSSILRMENLRVGFYSSPHLVNLRERIQVNGLMINEIRFADTMTYIKKTLEDVSWRRNPPTYFEILTVAAFLYFKEMKIHVAVLEVGLGGLYDSTNIANAQVVGLTPISLEHTDKLGKTLSKIAVQKCGIIKDREIVVSAPQTPEVDAVIQKAAVEHEAHLLRVGKEIRLFTREYSEEFQSFDLKAVFGNFYDLELKLLGKHQMDNAAVAVGLAKSLEVKTRLKITDNAIRQGLVDARWPGRLEKIGNNPLVILDGAQNVDSAKKMLAGIKRHFQFEKLFLVLGVSSDKDLGGILSELMPDAHILIATQSKSPRALPTSAIVEHAKEFGKEILSQPSPAEALEKAKSLASPNDLIVVTGSLFVVGEVKEKYA